MKTHHKPKQTSSSNSKSRPFFSKKNESSFFSTNQRSKPFFEPNQIQRKEEKNEDKDKYKKFIEDSKIAYTCNCGWIDKTHAFTDTTRKESYIGVKNLWNQIKNETGMESNSPNEEGFKVTYGQDATIIQNTPIIGTPIRIGATNSYFVKKNLSLQQKERVALAIFQEVSKEFEEFQSWGWIIGRGDSSFEPADLISNLLSFYRILRPNLDKNALMKLCGELDGQKSLDIYDQYPGTFSEEKYKNREFSPKYFETSHCEGKKEFPKELQEIKPAVKNTYFRDWLPIFDIHAGIPPLTGPKY